MATKSSQRGVALILALSVFALISGIAVSVLSSVQREVSLVERVQNSTQWQETLLGGEAWATGWLSRLDLAAANALPLDRAQSWLLTEQTFPLEQEGDSLAIQVIDRQSCINVNGLADPERQPLTQQWLVALSEQLGVSNEWVYWLTDWLDANQDLSASNGREDEYYLGLETPYRTADGPMTGLSEWALLNLDADLSTRLAPYICSLPLSAGVNINRAPQVVWRAMLPQLNEEQSTKLQATLDSAGFDSLDAFIKDEDFAELDPTLEATDWSVQSQLVEVLVTLTQNNRRYYLHSALYKQDSGLVATYYRAFGQFDTITQALLAEDDDTGQQP